MNKPLLVAVPLFLLATFLCCVQIAAAQDGAADPKPKSTDAAPARSQKARELPRPVTDPEREESTYRILVKPTNADFLDLPLEDALSYFSDFHGLDLQIDKPALAVAKISVDSPVTLKMDGVPLRRALNRVLVPLDLDWHVEGPGLLVTTRAPTNDAVYKRWGVEGPVLLVTTRAGLESRLDDFLKYEIQLFESLCELTDPQTNKLRLAGRGDIQRLQRGLRDCKARMQLVKDDDKKFGELLAEIDQLHQGIETGPFGKDSVFRKALETLLNPEQLVKYKPIQVVFQAGGLVATRQRGRDVFLSVQLSQTTFTDDGLANLKTLSNLGSLNLNLTKVTDAGLNHLKELTSLRELGLVGTQITDAGLVHLKGLMNLQRLYLGGTQVTDAGLIQIKDLTNLQVLNLRDSKVTDAGITELRKSPPKLRVEY
jgi:hypothetical protein